VFLIVNPQVIETSLSQLPWQQLQSVLDACFPRPPRDVFQRVVASSHQSQRAWLAMDGSSLVGIVMLSPHSKGGHLDNLAVNPDVRGQGIGRQLVQALLEAVAAEGPAMVTLTTRIPTFFASFGFLACGELDDGSTAMLLLLPSPSSSKSLTS
jgi:GNAT superfamily N-acetyltransferase